MVNQTSIYNTGPLPVRGSPPIGSDIGVQIELTMPDEGTEIIRVSRDTATWQKGDENQQYVWFSLGKPFGMKTGDVVSITRWKNKIIKVETRDDLVILTADHPENQGIVRNPLLWSIFGMLLIAVLIWTCYEILRKPR